MEETKTEPDESSASVKDLICDAFGRCKHKITGVYGKGIEAVSKKAHESHEETKNTLKTAVDTGKTLQGDVRRNVSEEMEIVSRNVASKAKEGLEKAENVADYVKDKAKMGKEKAENVVHAVKDKAKTGVEKVEDLADNVKDKAKDGVETAETAISRLKDFAQESWAYLTAAIGSLLGVIHLLGFAMAYGMSVWITFVSSYVLANALPRQQFAMVQSKIYPLYFKAMAYSIGVALLGHILSQTRHVFERKAEVFQGYNLLLSLIMVFANLLYLEPEATKVMYERMKVEKEEGRGKDTRSATTMRATTMRAPTLSAPTMNATTVSATTVAEKEEEEAEVARSEIVGLNERLKMLNSLSSTANIVTLMCLTWHLVYLGQRLNMSSSC